MISMSIVFFVLGLCFGSFVNMLVYRTAVQYDLMSDIRCQMSDKKRSFCDFCGRQLRWYENVPVVSWIFQKGKTKCCKKKLPLSYPVVELTMAILFMVYELIMFHRLDMAAWQLVLFLIGLIIIVLLVFEFVFDWKYMILPDFSTVILILMALIMITLSKENLFWQFVAALGASGFFLFLNLATKGNGMGMGDVKLAVFMGLFLGTQKIILALYIAFIVGAAWGIVLMILKKANKKSQVPFGPFMILGFWVAWWWGDLIFKFVNIKIGLW
jgi:prepilin signal peptidase PulO-like enzyme (type II secretory pathway)